MRPLLRAVPVLLLMITACTTEGTSSSPEQSAPGQEQTLSTEQEETLSAQAETWCAEHLGAVSAAATRMPRGVARFEMVDRTPPAVQAAKSLDRPHERVIEIWKDADSPSWNSNCSFAYSALGDLDESSWSFCHENASELGSVAYSMGFADVVSGSLRDEMESDIESADEEVRRGGYSRLALYLWLIDFGQWEEACREARQPGS